MANTLHTRCIKWNHIGKRSNNNGLLPWAKREFKQRTNHMMRKHCVEVEEFEADLLFEQQFKHDWMRTQLNLREWLKFEVALNCFD